MRKPPVFSARLLLCSLITVSLALSGCIGRAPTADNGGTNELPLHSTTEYTGLFLEEYGTPNVGAIPIDSIEDLLSAQDISASYVLVDRTVNN